MTESEWLACEDRVALQNFLQHHPCAPRYRNLERRFKLYTCACCRLLGSTFPAEVCRQAVVIAEAYADGEVDTLALAKAHAVMAALPVPAGAGSKVVENPFGIREVPTGPEWEAQMAAYYATYEPGQHFPAGETQGTSFGAQHGPACVVRAIADLGRRANPSRDVVAIFRDIFGNPFRPVTFASEWRSDTAVSLARHIYEGRDFSAMPILADALEDAGCDNADVLNHCRDANRVHVRGCWVVDGVLGKE